MIPEHVTRVVTGDGVTLEARLATPPEPAGGVVICHPHPLYGGDMDNPVVVRVAEVCGAAGLATLRFNFRGVGGSGGTRGGGREEAADVEAALGALASRLGPGRPLALAGYSFGAAVAVPAAARRDGLAGLALIGLPLALPGLAPLASLATFSAPVLLVSGADDEYSPREPLERLGAQIPHATVRIIEGANHFFFGKLFPLGEAVAAWARELGARQPRGRGGAR